MLFKSTPPRTQTVGVSRAPVSFDHFIGTCEEEWRERQTNLLRRFDIHDPLARYPGRGHSASKCPRRRVPLRAVAVTSPVLQAVTFRARREHVTPSRATQNRGVTWVLEMVMAAQ